MFEFGAYGPVSMSDIYIKKFRSRRRLKFVPDSEFRYTL